jgi:hypothetical protein
VFRHISYVAVDACDVVVGGVEVEVVFSHAVSAACASAQGIVPGHPARSIFSDAQRVADCAEAIPI